MNLPNRLTLFRIILVPIMVLVPYLNIEGNIYGIPLYYLIINLIFIIAAITDKLDGAIARKNNQITNFGKFLDPIADKILVLAAMIMLVEFNKIPGWIPILILFRELIVSGYRLIASQNDGEVIAASKWGKIKTVTQMTAIITSFIDVSSFCSCFTGKLSGIQLIINFVSSSMMIVCVLATVFSGWDYLKKGKDLLKDK